MLVILHFSSSYLQMYQQANMLVASTKAEMDSIIKDSAVIHDAQLRNQMHEIDNLDLQVEQLENQLQSFREV